jgi:hypothetical protein
LRGQLDQHQRNNCRKQESSQQLDEQAD